MLVLLRAASSFPRDDAASSPTLSSQESQASGRSRHTTPTLCHTLYHAITSTCDVGRLHRIKCGRSVWTRSQRQRNSGRVCHRETFHRRVRGRREDESDRLGACAHTKHGQKHRKTGHLRYSTLVVRIIESMGMQPVARGNGRGVGRKARTQADAREPTICEACQQHVHRDECIGAVRGG